MQSAMRADDFFRAGVKVAKGMSLIGTGITVSCLSKPAYKFLTKPEVDEGELHKNVNLSWKCVKDCFASGATTSMVTSGLYSSFIGTLLLTSRYDVNSVTQAAKLTGCLPLFVTGMSTLNSTRLLLQRWARTVGNKELIELSLSAGLFGAISAGCLHACYRLFPSLKIRS
jgi:hypothetical protein